MYCFQSCTKTHGLFVCGLKGKLLGLKTDSWCKCKNNSLSECKTTKYILVGVNVKSISKKKKKSLIFHPSR